MLLVCARTVSWVPPRVRIGGLNSIARNFGQSVLLITFHASFATAKFINSFILLLLGFRKQCLRKVLEIVLENLDDDRAVLHENLSGYAENDEQPFCKWNIPWPELKSSLELIGRNDLVKHLQETTLLTRGIHYAIVLKKYFCFFPDMLSRYI